MEDLLHVLVLLEGVDQLEHLGRLVLGQLGQGDLGHVLRLGRRDRDAARLDRRGQLAEGGKGAADDDLGLALVALALAELLEPVVDQLELERLEIETGRR